MTPKTESGRAPGTYRTPDGGIEVIVGIEESASYVEDMWPDEVAYIEQEAAGKAVAEVAAGSMRVSADDIRKALANLRGPVTRDESIVMACAQAILWELDARAALIASERKPSYEPTDAERLAYLTYDAQHPETRRR